RRRHTRFSRDWSSDVCSSDLGTDEQRASDLNAMYADPEVRAVFAMRGGWGCARILPLLDWRAIRANPKLLIGFSDVTALHLAFRSEERRVGKECRSRCAPSHD